jgi:hypothetical protein
MPDETPRKNILNFPNFYLLMPLSPLVAQVDLRHQ